MAEISNITLYKGGSARLRFRLIQPENVTSWTTHFTMREGQNPTSNLVFEVDGGLSDPTDVPNAAAIGSFDVIITKTEIDGLVSNRDRDYFYSFKRTNPGVEDVLAYGVVTVKVTP